MKITNVKIKTNKDESIKFKEVSFIGIGSLERDAFRSNQICMISSDHGDTKFNLQDVGVIEFCLDKDKVNIFVHSHTEGKDEK